MRSLKRGGRMLTCGATAGYDPKTDIRFIWTFELKILGSNSWTVQDMETLMAMIAEGRLTPDIDRVLPVEPGGGRAEEHTVELQYIMGISYDGCCFKKKI